ncbi:hypothetical protein BTA51_15885 [Hahella sp. CCB-MM4]|uniref:hypothetical protein n=1 Tax=Hahella sp. (strain CCB-MM4) TaxID=1926491 RepID=UPI000B9A615B|nr:hypothetical protein [Hahella sp. CCB-MM4]OZG72587.1 hypothetical protein BTA51_15885 [Hahella sp. CCB-MM4]
MNRCKHVPAHFKMTEEREIVFRSDIITRYSVKDPSDAVLDTLSGMSFIDAGETRWKLSLTEDVGIVPSASPDRVTVEASWYTAEQAQEAGIKVIAGSDANVFAGLGAILVPDDFKIPAVIANEENVKFYGITLLKNDETFTITSDEYDIVLMSYDYKDNYRADFLTQEHGGGGFFVERHNFPHIHAPLSSESGGYIIIGKQNTANSFSFTAFNIPHGHAFYIPSNTIHGDGALVGKYAISVAKTSAAADTVLFYNKHTIKKADNIVPEWN